MKLRRKITISTFRHRLASINSVPQFAVLGVASGIVTGVVIIGFRLLLEWPLNQLVGDPEGFEALGLPWVILLPIAGALAILAILALFDDKDRQVGVVHVLERLDRHQGHLPVRNALLQFVTGAIALASGQSGGREGPAIHLGAAGSSLIGSYLNLPNNSIRVLVGCGAAAAIAASFNTPIAGVIFSMEVIIMEYTIAGFVPVILAAVVAALLAQLVFGTATAFNVPSVSMASLLDIPVVIIEGIFVGLVAVIFVRLLLFLYSVAPKSLAYRLIIAGTLTGLTAAAAPQVLGVGYDTVNLALVGDLGIGILLATITLKIALSAAAIAFGMPVGIIGPTLFIGALAGGLFALAAGSFAGLSTDAFYVILGMGAMMGAVLQAPLAALMAVVELTGNPAIILPAMLVIVIANLTASHIFNIRSIFLMQMQTLGMEFRQNPLSMALNRASVASIMSRNFVRVNQTMDLAAARQLLLTEHHWLMVDVNSKPKFILRFEDLARFLQDSPPEIIDLAEIPATRRDITGILLQATLSEALDTLNETGVQALYVNRISAPLLDSPVGIVTRQDLENFYQA